MINTECGEMEELRLDDWVKNEFGWVGRVIQINDDGEFFVESDQCSDDHIWTDVNCTLLHRPFQVGDEVVIQQSADAQMGYVERWEETHTIDDLILDELNLYDPEHKQESWRDHSEWSGA